MSSPSAQELAAESGAPVQVPAGDRFVEGSAASLATRTARGSIINGAFLAAINVLGLVKGLVAASLLAATDYGLWGLIGAAMGLIFWLGAVGIDDKYIQQDHADQQTAFQVAFTLQCALAAVLGLAVVVGMPLFALVYGRPEMIAPGIALAVGMPALALQSPLWVFWRRMDFLRQRSLQVWDPVVSLVATVALAVAGFGIWALVLGSMAGSWAAAVAAVRASPYPLRWRYEPGALREYATFSWPLLVGSATGVLVGLVPTLVASRAAGLAAVGAITLANTVAQFANRVDEVITQVLYPAVCAVKDQADLLFASFTKSNRLALLWAMPCGAAGALFAGDFVHYVIGEKWRFAVTLIQVFVVTAAVNQIGFNWTAFFRALGRTRPIAVANLALLGAVVAIAVPLLLRDGIDGYAYGMAAATAVLIAVRMFFLTRIFPALRIVGHVGRAMAPTIPGVLAVLGLRLITGPGRPGGQVVAEVALFVVVVVAGTLVAERALLREAIGYLRGQPGPEALSLA